MHRIHGKHERIVVSASCGRSRKAGRTRRNSELSVSEIVLGGAMFLVWCCLVAWANVVSVSEDEATECMSRACCEPVAGRTMLVAKLPLNAQDRPPCN